MFDAFFHIMQIFTYEVKSQIKGDNKRNEPKLIGIKNNLVSFETIF